jgi:2-isopropylmalate synthase
MVQILDSTLREGEQTPGVYFDSHLKLAIADQLNEIGIDYLEAGHPAVDTDIEEAVKKISKRKLNLKVCAHSRSLRKDIDLAIECGVDFIGVFYCVSNGRLTGVFKKTINSAVDQIRDVISYAKEKAPNVLVRYTPEDTVRSDYENVIKAATTAVSAGADIISIADTTGYMIPGTERSMFDYVSRLKTDLSEQGFNPKIAVHCHNDRGLALANAIDGYRAGADIIDASVLGLGERAGIVDLAQLMVVLKTDFNVENNWNLKLLPRLYHLVETYSKLSIPDNYPITGGNAFTHCAGIHTHAAAKNPVHYQSLDNELLGREMNICLDHMAGVSAVKYSLKKIGLSKVENDVLYDILDRVKDMGQKGRKVNSEELKHIYDWCVGEA